MSKNGFLTVICNPGHCVLVFGVMISSCQGISQEERKDHEASPFFAVTDHFVVYYFCDE
jgi:hypothetical protein